MRQDSDSKSLAVEVCREFVLPDVRSDAGLPLRIYAPKSEGLYPVIVFCHGAGASKDAYTRLTRYWAAQGYVCIQPTHLDSLSLRKQMGCPTSLKEIFEELKTDQKAWARRAQDVSDLIKALPEIERSVGLLNGRVDFASIGLAGHSYGAYTALLVAGATTTVPGQSSVLSYKGPPLKAVVALSAPGRSSTGPGFDEHSFAGLQMPLLIATGSKDSGLNGQPPSWRTEPYVFAPAGDKYLAYIEGACHISFTGSSMPGILGAAQLDCLSPQLRQWLSVGQSGKDHPEVFNYLKSITGWFWDRYLKGLTAPPPGQPPSSSPEPWLQSK